MHKGKHIALAPIKNNDLAALFQWINERQQVLFNSSYKPVTEKQHLAWFDALQDRHDGVIFGIRLLEKDLLIGSCQLLHIHPIHRNAELQIRLGEVSYRGKGYGTEAVQLLLSHAFSDINLERVYLHVFAENHNAIAVYKKTGFIQEGILRKAAYINGLYQDILIMGILKEEFLEASSKMIHK